MAVTFVATADGKTVAGYYTLSQYAIQLDAVPEEILRKLPKYPMVPTTLVGRLAVRLMDALHRSFALSEQVASAGAMVDAKDESAVSCYRKYGFLELP